MVVPYTPPERWILYNAVALIQSLTDAKAAVLSLTSIPYQRSWAEALQEIELKREVAGTSRIEGADFTERELDIALQEDDPDVTLTRSQRQARAAKQAYDWIAKLPKDRPIDQSLILEVHRRIVTGCDDDHCPPGVLRGDGHNVTFGRPRHRGVEGGKPCAEAFDRLCAAVNQEFRNHDPLIQALALHYHLAAMHPFLDGNGRVARALEALMLRKARLGDDLFIAMSNYYYDEKDAYLEKLANVRDQNYDLTEFLDFGLRGIASQCNRLLSEIRTQVAKSLFRDVMGRMYGRLESTRKRALARRQMAILQILLDSDQPIEFSNLLTLIYREYRDLKAPAKAMARDLAYLIEMEAVHVESRGGTPCISARLEWATEITETDFYERINKLPEAKTYLVPKW